MNNNNNPGLIRQVFECDYCAYNPENLTHKLYCFPHHKIDGLVQERFNSSALAMELRLSCTNPLKSSQW